MVMSKKTTGLPLAIASKTIGSAIVKLMVATCGAAAKQLFTMRFRRRRLRRYDAATAWLASRFCNARFGDRRTQRGDASASAARGAARQAVPNEAARLRAATKLAGVDARV